MIRVPRVALWEQEVAGSNPAAPISGGLSGPTRCWASTPTSSGTSWPTRSGIQRPGLQPDGVPARAETHDAGFGPTILDLLRAGEEAKASTAAPKSQHTPTLHVQDGRVA